MKRRRIVLVIACAMAFMLATMLVCMIAEGKNILFAEDFEGRIYSAERGYFEAGGKTYYAHKTKSKMYYFGADGAMITRKTSRNKTTRYIDFNKDGSVHYVYPAGYGEVRERYNANRRRFQVLKHGKWRDTGMQVWPYGWIDWQE